MMQKKNGRNKRKREELGSSNASIEPPRTGDLTSDDHNKGESNDHSVVPSPPATTQSLPDKKQKTEGQVNINDLIEAYRNDIDPQYEVRFIWSDTPDDELIQLLVNDATFLVISRKKKSAFVKLVCRKAGVPFVWAGAKVRIALKRQDGEHPVAACFTGTRPKDFFAFAALKQSRLARLLRETAYCCGGWKKKIKHLFDRVLADCGGIARDSPIVSGALAVWQLLQQETPCLALICLPIRTEGLMTFVLNACRERSIPHFLVKRNEPGLEIVTGDVDVVCLRALHTKEYEEELVDLIRLCDTHCLTKVSIPRDEADARISRLFDYFEKQKPTLRESNTKMPVLENQIRGSSTDSASQESGDDVCEGHGAAGEVTCTSLPRKNGSIGKAGVDKVTRSGHVDDTMILLEERIAVLESSVEATRFRRKTIDDQIARVVVSVEELEGEVDQLESKQADLRLSLQKQTALQQDLQKVLEKSEHHLQKLQSPDTHLTQDEIAHIVRTGERVSNAMELAPGDSAVPEDVIEPVVKEGAAAVIEACEAPLGRPHAASIADHRLRQFWEAEKPSCSRIGTFVPCLASDVLISSMLSVTASEVILTDSLSNDGWQHRRQCMWNTCLDIRMLLSSPPASSTKTEGCSSLEKPSIDPNIQLCPYELSGECQDDYCAYQHLKERFFGRILPRELLPLPRLLLTTNPQNKEADSVSGNGPSANCMNLPSTAPAAKSMKKQPKLHTDEVDYLKLPDPDSHDEPPFAIGHPASSETPLTDAQRAPTELIGTVWFSRANFGQSLTGPTSVIEVLQNMGFSFDDESCVLQFERHDSKFVLPESFEWIELTVNCFCLTLHAGRFDISQALLQDMRKRWRRWKLEAERPNVVEKMVFSLLQTLDSLESRMFAYESHGSKDTFYNPLEVQFVAAVLGMVLSNANECQVEDIDNLAGVLGQIVTVINDNDEPPEEANVHAVGEIVETVKALFEDLGQQAEFPGDQTTSSLLHVVKKGHQIKRMVTRLKDLSCVGGGILSQCTRLFGDSLKSAPAMASVRLGGTWIVGNVVLGVLEGAAKLISTDSDIEHWQTKLMDLCQVIDRTLYELQEHACHFPAMEFLLSSLYAANVAFAATLRLYNRAHRKLVSLLAPNSTAVLCVFSELLWSQLVQLEALLPGRAGNPPALSPETRERHELLAKHIYARGVHPHHVALANDWNLTNILSENGSDSVYQSCLNITDVLRGNRSVTQFVLEGHELSRRRTRGVPLPLYTTIPQSLLLIGSSLTCLTLSDVELDILPKHFGRFFNRLEMLDLSRNHLEEIPDSLFTISTLLTLLLSNNELSLLPSKASMTELEVLDLSFNNLKAISQEFAKCQQLKEFHLKGNPLLGKMVWELAAQLPNLLEFSCDPMS